LKESSAINKEPKYVSKSSYPADKIYDTKSNTYPSNYVIQSQLPKSPPDPTYNSHNLSLPLTNTATHRLENSPYGYSENRVPKEKIEERLNHNKSPMYKDVNKYHDNVQPYYPKDEHKKYGETNYQKMVQRQENHYGQEPPVHDYQPHTPNMANDRQNFERRTPDTYGRSAIVPGYYNKGRAGDYEDIYNTQASPANQQNYGKVTYRRPLSPLTYEEKKSLQNNQYAEKVLNAHYIVIHKY